MLLVIAVSSASNPHLSYPINKLKDIKGKEPLKQLSWVHIRTSQSCGRRISSWWR